MPLYEYECEKCGKQIEVLQGMNDPAPECHGPMKKLISRSSFHLKGTGWYVTDYKNKPKGSKNANRKVDKPNTSGKVRGIDPVTTK